jgi:hypothetical protein
LRQQAFEQAVQMRMDAAEADFTPSEGPSDAAEETQTALAFALQGHDHTAG